jgi:PPOX class probable FMN-dependent enzyme
MDFEDLVTSIEELDDLYGRPSEIVAKKVIDHIDEHARSFLAQSPFCLIASSDGEGHFDVSPKGDPPGFVRVLDERTIAVPDRPGNRRVDTWRNVVRHPHVGLIFLIPGAKNTLRISGRARLVRDLALREYLAERDKVPELALVVDVEEVMMHCAKCIIRSQLWEEHGPVEREPSLARAMVDHGGLDHLTYDEVEQRILADEVNRLY